MTTAIIILSFAMLIFSFAMLVAMLAVARRLSDIEAILAPQKPETLVHGDEAQIALEAIERKRRP